MLFPNIPFGFFFVLISTNDLALVCKHNNLLIYAEAAKTRIYLFMLAMRTYS